jgi:hypothetical protein
MRVCLNRILLVIVTSLSLVICACPRVWYFTVTDASDFTQPEFCFSSSGGCVGSGTYDGFIQIDEVNERGEEIKSMWQLQRTGDKPLKKLLYGVVPEGYIQRMEPEPLEIGKWYTVESTYFFRLNIQQGKISSEVYDFDDFIKKVKHGNSD